MYSAYIYSYQFLKAYEVALFTIFTPIYVTLINDLYNKKINQKYLVTSSLAVLGAAIIVFKEFSNSDLVFGFFIVQISNITFALGQVAYKKALQNMSAPKDHELFAWMFLGGLTFPLFLTLFSIDLTTVSITSEQWLVLLYLGVVASGVGFFLWNYGARRTNTGALAIFNNLKVPLAIAVSILAFGETTNITNLIIGGFIVLGSLILNQYILSLNSKTQNTSNENEA
jgi:drug/metabolite transporter (DMT)-like permease